ncbi:MAG: transposase [Pyrinomonadaceae bacterium]
MNDHEWDDNEAPLAFLITFRTYGTWLHGDEKNAVDRHGKNLYGGPKALPSRNLKKIMTENSASGAFVLDGKKRRVVERAIRAVCRTRGYQLVAINVRTNHVHIVVIAYVQPEKIINAFKANATRELREAKLVDASQQVWSRGGSRRYLWKPSHVAGAVEYVLYGQGDDLPDF